MGGGRGGVVCGVEVLGGVGGVREVEGRGGGGTIEVKEEGGGRSQVGEYLVVVPFEV